MELLCSIPFKFNIESKDELMWISFFSCFSSLLSLFTRTTGERNLGKDGRHQEEDASHEA